MSKCLLPLIAAGILLFGGQAFSAEATFVGSDTCAGCHEEIAQTHGASIHAQAWVSIGGKYSDAGCESCHGPGSVHAATNNKADIVTYGTDQAALCLNCHDTSSELAFWDMGAHGENDVSCGSCHDVHQTAKPKVNSPGVCFSCHRDIKSDANKQSHHPIVEGKVSCNDCHNPHGALSHGQLRADSKNELCYNCHADKRGPFLWEHPPVEEDCGSCHESHGSRHNNLLASKMPNICQDCHDWSRHPGTVYDAATNFSGSAGNRFIARSCLNCHGTIHGSNAPHNPDAGYNGGHFFVR